MTTFHRLAAQLPVLLHVLDARIEADARRARERGDVPGWVLITMMTAGLVTVLWVFAGQQLQDIFAEAMNRVRSQQ